MGPVLLWDQQRSI